MEDLFTTDAQEKEQREVDTENIKCQACGSNMVFNPSTQKLLCEHCGTEQSFATDIFAEEQDLAEGFDKAVKWTEEEAVVFNCDNCGAKVVLQIGETATSCPFCGTAHVTKSKELAGIKPNALVPFAFDGDRALELSKAWAKKCFFAPTKFKKNLKTDNVKGVYTPCFTFDSKTISYYEGRLGTTHTRTVGSGKNRRVQTYVVWRNVRGTYYMNFDDVLITAGSKFNQASLNKVAPYATNASREYEGKYLLGYMAYHYDCDLFDCWNEARNSMESSIRRAALAQYHYDKIAYFNVSTRHEQATYKYVLLPVYIGNYIYKKKTYNFFVNGETGKVGGKTPKSLPKILLTVLGGLAAIVGLALLVL